MIAILKRKIVKFSHKLIKFLVPETEVLFNNNLNFDFISSYKYDNEISETVKLYSPYKINNAEIGDFTIVAQNSIISLTKIGKYCSIGPNCFSELGRCLSIQSTDKP